VLLFNTWREPPTNIEEKPPGGTTRSSQLLGEVNCNDRVHWRSRKIETPVSDEEDKDTIRMKVGLLGSAARRGRLEHSIVFLVSPDIKKSLLSKCGGPEQFLVMERR
jgi:hypothetical protein